MRSSVAPSVLELVLLRVRLEVRWWASQQRLWVQAADI